jgi:hypothetical protein
MPDFNVRSDSVNVEQIMEQIRSRIREKRGVDYTEQQIREMAAVKLEKFLDPRGVRSDLLDQFRRQQVRAYEPPLDTTIFETHRRSLRLIRKLLRPILKLFFNPNALVHALEREAARKQEQEVLNFEVLHNLVIELTRMGIEVKNLKMRVESASSRLDFNERRARALESAVVYRPAAEESAPAPPPAASAAPGVPAASGDNAREHEPATAPEGPGQRSRRRRRQRGRRSGASATVVMGGTVSPSQSAGAASTGGSFDLTRQDAAGDASGAHAPSTASGHSETAESMEQAIAVESHPHEGCDESSSNGPQGQDPDQQ